MEEEKTVVDFQLSKTLKYSEDGKFETTATIMMHAPSMAVFDEESALSQLVMGAFAESQKFGADLTPEQIKAAKDKSEKDKTEKDEMDADTVKMMLYTSQGIKFIDIARAFKRLAIKVCCVADDTKMTNPMFDKMDINDFKGLVCSYIVNFITPSLLPE